MSTVLQLKPRINLVNEKKIDRVKWLTAEMKKNKEELDGLKKELITAMGDRNELRNAENHRIAWVTVSNPEKFNSKQFKIDYPEIATDYVSIGSRTTFYTA